MKEASVLAGGHNLSLQQWHHIWAPVPVLEAPFPIQLPVNTCGESSGRWSKYTDSPAPTMETQMKLLAPAFSLAQSWPLRPCGK